MPDTCPTGFDETLLSGYLDGELTQGREQRVRLHLEDCGHCRRLLDELSELRETTMSTRFEVPDDDQWDERPRGALSASTRRLGWVVAVVWLMLMSGFAIVEMWRAAHGVLERLVAFGGVSAVVLLFASVLVDRLRTARTDRYLEVDK
jgi:predicted anti-sigma-YlaC factor YlaD